jgi:hypothetical protein
MFANDIVYQCTKFGDVFVMFFYHTGMEQSIEEYKKKTCKVKIFCTLFIQSLFMHCFSKFRRYLKHIIFN